MKKLMTMVLGLMVAVGMAGMAIAGNIDSPGAPSAGSGMYTLQQVYDYLNAGTVPTIPGSFQEPSAGPGSTMKTTKEIVAAVATPFAQVNGPAAADVKKDVKFFSTASGSWGVKTGTLSGGGMAATGQTTSYQTGDDGYYQKGIKPVDNGNGTCTDPRTGLMWANSATSPACNSGSPLVWSSAISWAEGLVFAGYSDWRLSNLNELKSFYEVSNGYFAALTNRPGPGSTYHTWSSTIYAYGSLYPWYVEWTDGTTSHGTDKGNECWVRAVRSNQ